jgi:hypothetical protein
LLSDTIYRYEPETTVDQKITTRWAAVDEGSESFMRRTAMARKANLVAHAVLAAALAGGAAVAKADSIFFGVPFDYTTGTSGGPIHVGDTVFVDINTSLGTYSMNGLQVNVQVDSPGVATIGSIGVGSWLNNNSAPGTGQNFNDGQRAGLHFQANNGSNADSSVTIGTVALTALQQGTSFLSFLLGDPGNARPASQITGCLGQVATCSASPDITGNLSFGAAIPIAISPVPLPAAAWLLMSGIAGMAMIRRRKTLLG